MIEWYLIGYLLFGVITAVTVTVIQINNGIDFNDGGTLAMWSFWTIMIILFWWLVLILLSILTISEMLAKKKAR